MTLALSDARESGRAQHDTLRAILSRFRILARRRALWLRHLWNGSGGPGTHDGMAQREADALLDDRCSPEAEAAWSLAEPWFAEWTAELKDVEALLATDASSRFARIRRLFALDRGETDLLEACVGVSLDPGLARACAHLNDHAVRSWITDELAARLYGHGRRGSWGSASPLFRWELIEHREGAAGEPRGLFADDHIVDWLSGGDGLHEALMPVGQVPALRTPLPSWPVEACCAFLDRHAGRSDSGGVRITIAAAPGSGRRSFVAAVCAHLGMPLFVIDADAVDDPGWRRTFMLAQRHAYLHGCALAWTGESLSKRPWPAHIPAFPIQFVIVEPGQEIPRDMRAAEQTFTLPRLGIAERERLWSECVPPSTSWPDGSVTELASRYQVKVGDIVAAARHGSEGVEAVARSLREIARGRLGTLAQLLPCTFEWSDLVVSRSVREALEDMVFEAGHRGAFWEQPEPKRMFPQGQGLLALFSGPPGTGKTMAAQVVAASLKYDLFRVDLAAVVSKWVGETSQNLERILSRAADMHAIVLFDECDALFSRRTTEIRDAQDKFANTDAAYLLQAIESYPGMAILATNLKGNVDPAFIRRLRYVVEFARPEAFQRLEIWRNTIRGLAGEERAAALEAGIRRLSEAANTTGAQIKFAVLGAVFLAMRDRTPLSLEHLIRALTRELEKDGGGLSAREVEKILHGA